MIEEEEEEEEVTKRPPKSKSSSLKSRSQTPGSELGSRRDKALLHTFPGKVRVGHHSWLSVDSVHVKVGTLASIGHRALRIHVATVDAFPSCLSKYETTWSCLVEAVGDVKTLKDELDDLKGDHELKEQVIHYVSSYFSAMSSAWILTSMSSGLGLLCSDQRGTCFQGSAKGSRDLWHSW
jgi:hypothetical protein